MAKTLKSVLEKVIGTLQDDSYTTWTLQDLVRYGNDGALDMHVRRPDLFNMDVDMALIAGVRQTLPVNGSKLIEITHNTVGENAPVTLIQQALLNAQLPGWRSELQTLEIQHYMYDDRQPKVFDVFPPAKVGARLQTKFAAIPVDMPIPAPGAQLEDVAGDINVPDLQSVALQHYITARCFAESSESGNLATAQTFFSLYASDLGVEIQATKAVAPTANKP